MLTFCDKNLTLNQFRFNNFDLNQLRFKFQRLVVQYVISNTNTPFLLILTFWSNLLKNRSCLNHNDYLCFRKGAKETDKTNINRLMSKELLSNDRRVEIFFDCAGIRTTELQIAKQMHCLLNHPTFLFNLMQPMYISNKLYLGVRSLEITQK